MDFAELSKLKRDIDELLEYQVVSLKQYHLKSGGFCHKYCIDSDPSDEFSKASTATCIASIAATGEWTENNPWHEKTGTLVREMLNQNNWTSAGLPAKNPFTVAFLLEAVCTLIKEDPPINLSKAKRESKQKAIKILQDSLKSEEPSGEPGAAHLLEYPPSAYVTQLVVRSLIGVGKLTNDLERKVCDWSWGRIEHELSLYYSESPLADAYALAYSVILFATCSESSTARPTENQILKAAVTCIFKAQLPDGSWPKADTRMRTAGLKEHGIASRSALAMCRALSNNSRLSKSLIARRLNFAESK